MQKRIRWLIRCSWISCIILILAACGRANVSNANTTPESFETSAETAKTETSVLQSSEEEIVQSDAHSTGKIYLYGEAHGREAILEYELEQWKKYYHEQGMRHLFIEDPYYTAEFLNLWMLEKDDAILDQVYEEWVGTASYVPCVKEFYQNIKKECPETVFHGTDVGHQYGSTGYRYMQYLKKNGLENSEQYKLAEEAVQQGKDYGVGMPEKQRDRVARENYMVENFIREFEKLDGESIMGIYGGAHTGLDAMNISNEVPCMAAQLYEVYGEQIYMEDISWMRDEIEPERIDRMEVNGKEYDASYFGKQDLSDVLPDYEYREFWRLEGAYEDFKEYPMGQDVLPYDNYPTRVDLSQVFLVEYQLKDGSSMRMYYCSRGNTWNNQLVTEQVLVPDGE